MATLQMHQPNKGFSERSPSAPCTTVHISTEPPKDHFIWSIFCFSHFNICCLGLVALIYSVKARDMKVMGNMNGAEKYASTARWLNITSTVLIFVFCLIMVISVIAVRNV